jgi:hypothetical protein
MQELHRDNLLQTQDWNWKKLFYFHQIAAEQKSAIIEYLKSVCSIRLKKHAT